MFAVDGRLLVGARVGCGTRGGEQVEAVALAEVVDALETARVAGGRGCRRRGGRRRRRGGRRRRLAAHAIRVGDVDRGVVGCARCDRACGPRARELIRFAGT
jgi:hypothetical protein